MSRLAFALLCVLLSGSRLVSAALVAHWPFDEQNATLLTAPETAASAPLVRAINDSALRNDDCAIGDGCVGACCLCKLLISDTKREI